MFNFSSFMNQWLHINDVVGSQASIMSAFYRNGNVPNHWFVNAQLGSDSNEGRDPRTPVQTIATLVGNGSSSRAHSGDYIHVVGNVTEEVTGYNLLEDITIVGESNRPRHADRARDYATYAFATQSKDEISGSTWRQAASHGTTTPLLTVRGQGWRLVNMLMVPPSDAAAVYLARNALSDVSEYDASHFETIGCRFAGGQSGIEDQAGVFNVHILNCTFHGSTNGIKTLGTAVAQPLAWVLEHNIFFSNTNHIVTDFTQAIIRWNSFGKFTTQSIKLDQVGNTGGYNMIYGNALSGTYSINGGYKSNASTDEWGGNFNSLSGGVTADDPA